MIEQVQGSGASTNTSGAGGVDQVTDPSVTQVTTETTATPATTERSSGIKLEDHKRAIDDMMKFKRQAQEATALLEAERIQKLKDKENWKELYEQEKTRREESDQKRQSLHEGLLSEKKWDQVEKELFKAGIRAEAMDMIRSQDLVGVEAEFTTQGRVLVHGAESYVEALKKKYPFVFQAQGAVPGVNAGGQSPINMGKISATDVWNAEQAAKKDPTKQPHYLEVVKRFREQRTAK